MRFNTIVAASLTAATVVSAFPTGSKPHQHHGDSLSQSIAAQEAQLKHDHDVIHREGAKNHILHEEIGIEHKQHRESAAFRADASKHHAQIAHENKAVNGIQHELNGLSHHGAAHHGSAGHPTSHHKRTPPVVAPHKANTVHKATSQQVNTAHQANTAHRANSLHHSNDPISQQRSQIAHNDRVIGAEKHKDHLLHAEIGIERYEQKQNAAFHSEAQKYRSQMNNENAELKKLQGELAGFGHHGHHKRSPVPPHHANVAHHANGVHHSGPIAQQRNQIAHNDRVIGAERHKDHLLNSEIGIERHEQKQNSAFHSEAQKYHSHMNGESAELKKLQGELSGFGHHGHHKRSPVPPSHHSHSSSSGLSGAIARQQAALNHNEGIISTERKKDGILRQEMRIEHNQQREKTRFHSDALAHHAQIAKENKWVSGIQHELSGGHRVGAPHQKRYYEVFWDLD